MTSPQRHLLVIMILMLNGCALLNMNREKESNEQLALKSDKVTGVQNGAPVRRIVRLQTAVASALADDRRLRSSAWEELDESGLMSPEDRLRLNQSGIRVGVSGGTIPWDLASLLRGEQVAQMASRVNETIAIGQASSFGSDVAIPEGSTSMVELPLSEESLFIPSGEIAGLKNGAELNNARLVMEMTAVEYGDGWVLIRFLPQIHHGTVTTRHSISNTSPQMHQRQKVQPLYEQQFEVKLHTDETVVIGYHKRPEWTVGRLLFQSDTLSSKKEHLLALQLTAINEVTGQKSMTVNYSRY